MTFSLFEDIDLLKGIQGFAMEIISDDPLLKKDKNKLLRQMVNSKFKDRLEI